jgi:hypothetical protein
LAGRVGLDKNAAPDQYGFDNAFAGINIVVSAKEKADWMTASAPLTE